VASPRAETPAPAAAPCREGTVGMARDGAATGIAHGVAFRCGEVRGSAGAAADSVARSCGPGGVVSSRDSGSRGRGLARPPGAPAGAAALRSGPQCGRRAAPRKCSPRRLRPGACAGRRPALGSSQGIRPLTLGPFLASLKGCCGSQLWTR